MAAPNACGVRELQHDIHAVLQYGIAILLHYYTFVAWYDMAIGNRQQRWRRTTAAIGGGGGDAAADAAAATAAAAAAAAGLLQIQHTTLYVRLFVTIPRLLVTTTWLLGYRTTAIRLPHTTERRT